MNLSKTAVNFILLALLAFVMVSLNKLGYGVFTLFLLFPAYLLMENSLEWKTPPNSTGRSEAFWRAFYDLLDAIAEWRAGDALKRIIHRRRSRAVLNLPVCRSRSRSVFACGFVWWNSSTKKKIWFIGKMPLLSVSLRIRCFV